MRISSSDLREAQPGCASSLTCSRRYRRLCALWDLKSMPSRSQARVTDQLRSLHWTYEFSRINAQPRQWTQKRLPLELWRIDTRCHPYRKCWKLHISNDLGAALTMAAIGLIWTRVSTAPRYRRQSSPRRSGVGTIWNQFWKKRLSVGVKTSGSKSDMPLAKSFRNGTISAGLSADGAAAGTEEDVEAVRGSAFLLVVAVPDSARRIGRNSAGPSGRLETVSMD